MISVVLAIASALVIVTKVKSSREIFAANVNATTREIMRTQVVVILDEGGETVTFRPQEVELLEFNFSQFSDEIPNRQQLEVIKKDIDKVINDNAKAYLVRWYEENLGYNQDIEKSENERKLHETEERVERAKETLRDQGFDL